MTVTFTQVQNCLPQLQWDQHLGHKNNNWFLTRVKNFKVEFDADRNRFLFAWGQEKELLEEMAEELRDWTDKEVQVTKGIIVEAPETEEELDYLMGTLWDLATDHGTEPKQYGVTFEGTNFENYGERDFMAAVTQITKQGFKQYLPTGRNLVHEYVAAADSRIDAVELDENGNVTTVIECQAGIQHGEYLDAVHFEKAISRYPHITGAKRVVIIAGGYTEAQLATFAQLPFEVITLTTAVVDGQIELV